MEKLITISSHFKSARQIILYYYYFFFQPSLQCSQFVRHSVCRFTRDILKCRVKEPVPKIYVLTSEHKNEEKSYFKYVLDNVALSVNGFLYCFEKITSIFKVEVWYTHFVSVLLVYQESYVIYFQNGVLQVLKIQFS